MSAPPPTAWLPGRWSVRRTLHDRVLHEDGTFTGTAVFTPHDDGLRWVEEGTMRFGTHEGPAWRELAIRPSGGGWVVTFDDGRLFHPFDLAGDACAVDHPCGEDLYTGEYRRTPPDRLDVVWDVRGPRKDLRISSVYERLL